MPRARLLEATLDGVRLIEPVPRQKAARSCSAGHDDDAAAEPLSRGARSGLVQGLRGEGPFNGDRLPRLPWGNPPVPEVDIQGISGWIDAGCPEEAHGMSFPLGEMQSDPIVMTKVARGADIDAPCQGTLVEAPNEYKYQQGELKQRMNIDCMSEGQIDKLRHAMRELFALNKWPEDARSYNNMALIHQNHCQHG